MTDMAIVHTVEMRAPRADVFRALVGRAGPARSGWYKESTTAPRMNALSDFRFGAGEVVAKMRVAALEEEARVVWRCVDGPADWIGTDVAFHLIDRGEETI